MKEILQLEAEILSCFISYPQKIDEFLELAPLKCFSPLAQRILSLIIALSEEGILSETSLNLRADESIKGTELFLSTLGFLAHPNVLSLAPLLRQSYQLSVQSAIAAKLSTACSAKQLLDIEILSKELELNANEFKNLSEWRSYYETKPAQPVFASGISF